MRQLSVFTVIFLAAGIWSVTAQDIITMRQGHSFKAKVTEVTQTEIRY